MRYKISKKKIPKTNYSFDLKESSIEKTLKIKDNNYESTVKQKGFVSP